jgi:hypothetical protein
MGRNRLKAKNPWAEQIGVPVPTFMGPIGALVHRVWAAVHQLGVSRGSSASRRASPSTFTATKTLTKVKPESTVTHHAGRHFGEGERK